MIPTCLRHLRPEPVGFDTVVLASSAVRSFPAGWMEGVAVGKGWVHACLIGALCAFGTPALGQIARDADRGTDLARAPELPRVLPVWSTDSGRVEALLLIDSDSPGATPPSTLDSLLGHGRGTPGLRARTALGRTSAINLDLKAGGSSMALLCDGNIGLAVALGRLADPCLLAHLDADGQPRGFGAFESGRSDSAGVSMDWSSEQGGLDLSFGLSWLQARSGEIDLLGLMATGADPGTLANPMLLHPWRFEAHSFDLQGQHWMTPRSWLRVDGRHGSNRLAGLGLPVEWDSTSLSLSGGYRALSGSVTGRLIEINQPRQSWADVDIALSWRTPWDARVSVGARNLLGGPDRERWPLATLPGLPESDARTPYVRYHQDL